MSLRLTLHVYRLQCSEYVPKNVNMFVNTANSTSHCVPWQVGEVAVCTFDPLWPACKQDLTLKHYTGGKTKMS